MRFERIIQNRFLVDRKAAHLPNHKFDLEIRELHSDDTSIHYPLTDPTEGVPICSDRSRLQNSVLVSFPKYSTVLNRLPYDHAQSSDMFQIDPQIVKSSAAYRS